MNSRTQDKWNKFRAAWDYEQTVCAPCTGFAGVDEAGRGCLAGPVFAAAVRLGGEPAEWLGVDDSKKLTKRARETLYAQIYERALAVGVGTASVEEIDRYNILRAARLAMARAIRQIRGSVQLVVVDGPYGPLFEGDPLPFLAMVDGDAKCPSVGAASIVAKVERDRYMTQLAQKYPNYRFDTHYGYGTPQHLQALRDYGPCKAHRLTFGPVKRASQGRLL